MAGQGGDILFVVQSGGKQSKREKELLDAKRRAHAARHSKKARSSKWHHDRPEKRREDGPVLLPPAPTLPIQRYPILPSFDSLITYQPPSQGSEEGDDPPHLVDRNRPPLSPLSYLGQSRMDPFQTTLIGTLPPTLQRYLDAAQTILWPSIVPNVPQSPRATWWRQMAAQRHMSDAQIANAATIVLRTENLDPATTNLMIKHRRHHRNLAIQWINDEVLNASGPPHWQVISALGALIMHSGESRPIQYTRYPETPLAGAQLTDIFGAASILPEDKRFFWKLVDLKGGLDSIGPPLMANALPYLDIVFATRDGTRPYLPYRLPDPGASASPNQKAPLISPLGAGFASIRHPDLLHALSTCSLATQRLHEYRRRKTSTYEMRPLLLQRLKAQHALLSLLPSIEDPQPLPLALQLVQVAALLYSDLVLFALPRNSGARPRLVGELRALFERRRSDMSPKNRRCPSDNLSNEMLLWVLLVGAIACITAYDDSNLAHFSSMIAECSQHTKFPALVVRWEEVRDAMYKYLWWDYVLDLPGADVWKEVRACAESARAEKGRIPASATEIARRSP